MFCFFQYSFLPFISIYLSERHEKNRKHRLPFFSVGLTPVGLLGDRAGPGDNVLPSRCGPQCLICWKMDKHGRFILSFLHPLRSCILIGISPNNDFIYIYAPRPSPPRFTFTYGFVSLVIDTCALSARKPVTPARASYAVFTWGGRGGNAAAFGNLLRGYLGFW